jgi:ferredoxin/flavodoxin---NADP+ reductase
MSDTMIPGVGPAGRPVPMKDAIVTQRIDVAPDLMIVRLAADGWELPDFVAGQYVVLGMPASSPRCPGSDPEPPPADPNKMIRRAYSIASSSLARQYMEFYVALVRSGELTPRLFMLRVGDRVAIGRKITGMFTLSQVPAESNVVLLATGTGIAPYMSMIRTSLSVDSPRRFAVIHGARHSWDLGYHAELMSLAHVCPQFTYLPMVSRPDEEPVAWGGKTGYCQDVWTGRVLDDLWGFPLRPANTHVFLCGNPAMIEYMVSLLAEEGFQEHSRKSPGQVHTEKYW